MSHHRPMIAPLAIALALLAAGCASPPRDTITQVATIDALLAGVYDGRATLGELLRYGDTGIGTFDKLDGEMVVLDGVVHQIHADGSVSQPPASLTTPFATVCRFDDYRTIQTLPDFSGVTYASLRDSLDQLEPNQNVFVAFVALGHFRSVTARSVPSQSPPYRPLADIINTQTNFTFTDVTGTLVGFRCPQYAKGLNVPGYHVHFISADHTRGGHVLDFQVGDVLELRYRPYTRYTVLLPESHADFSKADLTRDRTDELHKVEQQR